MTGIRLLDMSEDRKKPGVAFWATVVLVAVLAYPLSLLPLVWLNSRDMIPDEGVVHDVVWVYCYPVRWLHDNGPGWFREFIDWAT
jgi:hypothetical protein